MGKFTYKFNSIKKVKEALEKKAQKEVASIDLLIEENENNIEKIKQTIVNNKAVLNNIKISARVLQENKNYEKALLDNIIEIEKIIEKLKNKRVEKLNELIKKSKDAKIFNTLEDIHKENFNNEEKRLEMLVLDEIASQKFSRSNNK